MTASDRRRVVITGQGVITPMGNSVDEFWANAVAGNSGIGVLDMIDATGYPCQVAGQVEDFEPTDYMDR